MQCSCKVSLSHAFTIGDSGASSAPGTKYFLTPIPVELKFQCKYINVYNFYIYKVTPVQGSHSPHEGCGGPWITIGVYYATVVWCIPHSFSHKYRQSHVHGKQTRNAHIHVHMYVFLCVHVCVHVRACIMHLQCTACVSMHAVIHTDLHSTSKSCNSFMANNHNGMIKEFWTLSWQ